MRGRAVIASLGAVLLAATVVMLRGQVEPPVADPAAVTPVVIPPSSGALPVRRLDQGRRWRSYELPSGTLTARADPEHVVLARTGEHAGQVITVSARDGSGREASYGPPAGGWQPADWLIVDGWLFVLEVQRVVDGESIGSRLVRVDLTDSHAEQIPIRSVQPLDPSMLAVGDELIVSGARDRNRTELCVIAVRASTGVERTVVCGPAQPVIESADGGVVIKMPDTSADGCSVRLLLPGRGEFGLPVFVGSCRQRRIIPLGTWQAFQLDGPMRGSPLLASDGNRQLELGTAKLSATACHGRLYWVTGGRPDSPLGVEVHRWAPGTEHVDQIFTARGDTELGRPSCTDGALSIRVMTAGPAGAKLVALRVLDRP